MLYISNNRIRDWAEVERLACLPGLEELVLAGNPLHAEAQAAGAVPVYRTEVVGRLPRLKKLDGVPVDVEEREAARAKP